MEQGKIIKSDCNIYIIDGVCVVPPQNSKDRPEGPLWGPQGPGASQKLAPKRVPTVGRLTCQQYLKSPPLLLILVLLVLNNRVYQKRNFMIFDHTPCNLNTYLECSLNFFKNLFQASNYSKLIILRKQPLQNIFKAFKTIIFLSHIFFKDESKPLQ